MTELQIMAQMYGAKNQSVKLCEELAELMVEMHRSIDGRPLDKAHVEEEMADVLLMMEQVIYLDGLDENKIRAIQKRKLNRQIARLKKETGFDVHEIFKGKVK